MTFLTEAQRRSVFETIIRLIDTRFMGTDPDTPKLRQEHEATVIGSETPESFEQAIDALLRALGTSHTGMFHESRRRSAGQIAMAATLTKAETSDGLRWVFQDVHPGGVAAAAGISPGDVLLAIGEQELIPPTAIPFRLGESYDLTIRKADGSTSRPPLAIPGSKEKKRPIVVPDQVVTARKLAPDVGCMRVSMFPGVLGIKKYVVSRSGDVETSWQGSVLLRDIADVKRLREEDGPNLVTQGSTELVHALLANDLVDAMSTFTVPVVLGGGKKLFADGSAPHSYKLTGSRVSSTGLMIAHYERGGEVKVADTALAEPSKAEAARQERMKREG